MPQAVPEMTQRTDWNMSSLDSFRISEILALIDAQGYMALSRHAEAVEPLYGAMRMLYYNLKPLFYESVKQKFDADFADIKARLVPWAHKYSTIQHNAGFPDDIVEDLMRIGNNLMVIRQAVGLAIPTRKVKSEKLALEEALHIRRAKD